MKYKLKKHQFLLSKLFIIIFHRNEISAQHHHCYRKL